VETGVNEIFQFKKDQKNVIRSRKESSHGKSTPEAHKCMGQESVDLRLTIAIAAHEGKRSTAAGAAEGSLASRTCC